MAVIFGSTGTNGDDTLDVLGNETANSRIDGGAGTDTLAINDVRSNYIIVTLNGITQLVGRNTATNDYRNDVYYLINTESITFVDTVFSLTTDSRAMYGNIGTSGNDVLVSTGNAVSEGTISGGAGTDTLVFFDNIENFNISFLAGVVNITVSQNASDIYFNDTYSITGVEFIQFLNGTYEVPGGGGGGPGEFIFGTSSNEAITGTNGDDTIDHGGGADEIDGVGGIDEVIFNGHSSTFRVTTLLGVTRVLGLGDAGANYAGDEVRMINVEKIQFRNTTVALEATPAGIILGGTAGESIEGTTGDDVIDHGGGADLINGGSGFDTVIFFDSYSNYRITTANGFTRVLGLGSAETVRAAAPYAGFETILVNVESIQFRDRRITTGGNGDDTLQTWGGRDFVEGNSGIDTAVFANSMAAYGVSRTAGAFNFTVTGAGSDVNVLANVERLKFTDLTLGFDLFASSPLYNTTLVGSAAVGPAFVDNPLLFGVGLRFAEGFANMQDLADAVVDLGIFDHLNNHDYVQQLFQNVQHTPTAEEAVIYEWALDFGVDRGQILRIFAESDYNEQSINLVGLQQTGVEFI